MCTGLEILAIAGAGASVYQALNAPKAPAVQAPLPAPQPGTTPAPSIFKGKMKTGAGDPTALTAGGVKDTLGKATILGS